MPDDLFRVEQPADQRLPIIVDVPHSGEWIPEEAAEEMVVGDQVLRRDLDLYVDQFWQDAPECGATLIVSNVSRYVVDLNRASDDVSPEAVEGTEKKYKEGYYQERGVVWRETTGGTPVMAEPLSRESFERRLETFYYPYHERLQEELERVRERFGYCILIDGHSMPSTGREGHSDPGRRRADIVPGDVDGESCARTIRWTVEQHFRDHGYSVRSNDPYKGGWITRRYGEPSEQTHAIQIEVNRDLYMNEETFAIKEEGLEKLRSVCGELLEKIGSLELD